MEIKVTQCILTILPQCHLVVKVDMCLSDVELVDQTKVTKCHTYSSLHCNNDTENKDSYVRILRMIKL